jgi:hypothetical protein
MRAARASGELRSGLRIFKNRVVDHAGERISLASASMPGQSGS